MTTDRDTIIRMAREAGFERIDMQFDELARFATLVAAAEREAMMQLFTDPENQPTQHDTVTVEYMQREIAAEREACAQVCERYGMGYGVPMALKCAADIRARGQQPQPDNDNPSF